MYRHYSAGVGDAATAQQLCKAWVLALERVLALETSADWTLSLRKEAHSSREQPPCLFPALPPR